MNSKEVTSQILQDWSRPLQKALTFEVESQFINIFGREKFFNEYIADKLTNYDHFNLNEEISFNLHELSNLYQNYNNLDNSDRKKLVLKTRKFLLKIIKLYDNKENNNSFISEKGTYSLTADVAIVRGVGKSLKNNLNQIGLFIIKDLIDYFPRTYLDYSNKVKIINLRPDNLYTCTGRIKKFFIYKSKNNANLSIMNIII